MRPTQEASVVEKRRHLAAAAGKNMLLRLLQIAEQCLNELRCGTIVPAHCERREGEVCLHASLFWWFFSCSIHSRIHPDLEKSSYRVRDAPKLQLPLTRGGKKLNQLGHNSVEHDCVGNRPISSNSWKKCCNSVTLDTMQENSAPCQKTGVAALCIYAVDQMINPRML